MPANKLHCQADKTFRRRFLNGTFNPFDQPALPNVRPAERIIEPEKFSVGWPAPLATLADGTGSWTGAGEGKVDWSTFGFSAEGNYVGSLMLSHCRSPSSSGRFRAETAASPHGQTQRIAAETESAHRRMGLG
jgi:hypothetical protein